MTELRWEINAKRTLYQLSHTPDEVIICWCQGPEMAHLRAGVWGLCDGKAKGGGSSRVGVMYGIAFQDDRSDPHAQARGKISGQATSQLRISTVHSVIFLHSISRASRSQPETTCKQRRNHYTTPQSQCKGRQRSQLQSVSFLVFLSRSSLS